MKLSATPSPEAAESAPSPTSRRAPRGGARKLGAARRFLENLPERNVTIELKNLAPVQARIYGQRPRGATLPLVLHFHGGAFVAGGLDNGALLARGFAATGAIVVSIAYPLAPAHPFPQPVEVGYGVLEWAWKHRAKIAGRAAPLFLAGEEAGGNLAAAVALIARDRGHPPLAGQVLIAPMLDPCVATASQRNACDTGGCKWADGWQQYLRSPRDAEHPYAVPAASSRLGGVAPTLMLSASDDPMRDEAQNFAAKLSAAGVPVQFEIVGENSGWPDTLTACGSAEDACCAQVQARVAAFLADPGTTTGAGPGSPVERPG